MFFLGIAGPLIPYFILSGILLAFTLETSKDFMPLDQEASGCLTTRILQNEPTSVQKYESSYFCFEDYYHKGHKQSKKYGAPGIDNLYFLFAERCEKEICNYIFHYSPVLICCYFGLSPPSSRV